MTTEKENAVAQPSVGGSTRMKKKWARRGNTVRYRPDQRFGDWWCARRDARAGVPGAPDRDAGVQAPPHAAIAGPALDDSQVWATPRTLLLEQVGRARVEREWIRFDADTADDLVSRADAAARLSTAQQRLRKAESDCGDAGETPTPQQLAVVAAGEEDADASVRQGRRQREHARRRAGLTAAMLAERETIARTEVEIARLDERVRIRREVAESRVAMIQAHVRQRCSAYLTQLVRRHPDGERIGSMLRSAWSVRPSRTATRPVAQPVGFATALPVEGGA